MASSSNTPITYADIMANKLTDLDEYPQWRDFLLRYLEQEHLGYVLEQDIPVNFSLPISEGQRSVYINHKMDHDRVKTILLSTMPLQFFLENVDRTPTEIMVFLTLKCTEDSAPPQEVEAAAATEPVEAAAVPVPVEEPEEVEEEEEAMTQLPRKRKRGDEAASGA